MNIYKTTDGSFTSVLKVFRLILSRKLFMPKDQIKYMSVVFLGLNRSA